MGLGRLFGILVAMTMLASGGAGEALAEDSDGCEGLEAYGEAMLASHEAYEDALEAAGIDLDDPFVITDEGWIDFAEAGFAWQMTMEEIEPPAWVADWHAASIETTGILGAYGERASEAGFFAIIEFEDAINEAAAASDEAEEDALAVCADFAEFLYDWDAADGEVDGTPVAVESTPESD